jgi:hypothetical protein
MKVSGPQSSQASDAKRLLLRRSRILPAFVVNAGRLGDADAVGGLRRINHAASSAQSAAIRMGLRNGRDAIVATQIVAACVGEKATLPNKSPDMAGMDADTALANRFAH